MIQWSGSTGVFILTCVIIIALVFDISLVRVATSIGGLGQKYFFPYVGLVLTFAVGQYALMAFVKKERRDRIITYPTNVASLIYLAARISQYVLLAILAFTILQMGSSASYSVICLKAIIFVSYGLSLALLTLLAKRFFSWFRSNRNIVVFIYALAIAILAVNSASVIVYTNNELDTSPLVVRDVKSLTGGYESSDIVSRSVFTMTSIISFILIWVATILLMKHYSTKVGKVRYWIAVAIPLAYFMSQFQHLFLYSFSDLRLQDPVLFGIVYNLFFTVAKPAGGILFGIAFWTVARNLSHPNVRRYMLISAFGMMLLFTANQPTYLVLVPYPPFGLVTISFVGLASYLLFLGIYSASVSVSQDSRLRKKIRNATLIESTRFLDTIGTAQMQQEIERKVLAMSRTAKENMERETGVSSSLEFEDVKDYLQRALQETRGKGGTNPRH